VTGAASGIGRATAIRLAAAGATVVVVDLDAVGADATVDSIRETGGQAVDVAADVTRGEDCLRAVDAAVSAYGGLDVIVNPLGSSAAPTWWAPLRTSGTA
jgi:NAD(P)-dependent dehydrogenase (short-subunit alcohol dehydrogenase family)